MNELAIPLATGTIHVGVLIVPSRDLYEHLTEWQQLLADAAR